MLLGRLRSPSSYQSWQQACSLHHMSLRTLSRSRHRQLASSTQCACTCAFVPLLVQHTTACMCAIVDIAHMPAAAQPLMYCSSDCSAAAGVTPTTSDTLFSWGCSCLHGLTQDWTVPSSASPRSAADLWRDIMLLLCLHPE